MKSNKALYIIKLVNEELIRNLQKSIISSISNKRNRTI